MSPTSQECKSALSPKAPYLQRRKMGTASHEAKRSGGCTRFTGGVLRVLRALRGP